MLKRSCSHNSKNVQFALKNLRITPKALFSSKFGKFSAEDMKSKDFLESLHIPKTEADIQKQLSTLG